MPAAGTGVSIISWLILAVRPDSIEYFPMAGLGSAAIWSIGNMLAMAAVQLIGLGPAQVG